jgi:hypothetical protein
MVLGNSDHLYAFKLAVQSGDTTIRNVSPELSQGVLHHEKRGKKSNSHYIKTTSVGSYLQLLQWVQHIINIMAKSTPFLHRQYINNQLRSSRPGIVPAQVRQSVSVSKTIGKDRTGHPFLRNVNKLPDSLMPGHLASYSMSPIHKSWSGDCQEGRISLRQTSW